MRQFFKTNISKSDPGNSDDGFQLPMLRNASGFSHQVDKMDFIFGVFFCQSYRHGGTNTMMMK